MDVLQLPFDPSNLPPRDQRMKLADSPKMPWNSPRWFSAEALAVAIVVMAILVTCRGCFGQTIRYVENPTASFAPLPNPGVALDTVHPEWRSMFTSSGDFARPKPPTALTDDDHANGVHPAQEMLRPFTRIYWVEGPNLPAPPAGNSPLWVAFDAFIGGNPQLRPENAQLDGYTSRVWSDERPAGDHDSLGAWANNYIDDWYSWSGPSHQNHPQWARKGAIPWAGGPTSNGHYDQALWCLEEYRRTGEPLAWQMFVKMALRQAGQGMNWQNGNWRYEKSRWVWTGDFYPDSYTRWSHSFPQSVLFFWHLTGNLSDAANKLFLHQQQNAGSPQARYNGYYGPRRSSWYLRSLRASDLILGEASVGAADTEARAVIDSVLAHTMEVDSGGRAILEYQGQPISGRITVDFLSGSWASWLFVSEATRWATKWDDTERLNKLGEIAEWLRKYTVNGHGQVAYTVRIRPNGEGFEAHYTSATHTAIALPAMWLLAALERYPAPDFRTSCTWLVSQLPYGIQGEPTQSGERDRRYGPSAPKVCGSLSNGLRAWVLAAGLQ